MSWHVLIIFHTVLVACSVLLLRVLARDKRTARASFALNGCMYPFLYLVGLCVLPFLGHVQLGEARRYLPWFIGGGLSFALTNVCTYKMLTYLDAGVSSILATVNVLFTIVLAALVLGEDLTLLQAVGSLMLFVTIIYVLLATRKPHKRYTPRVWYGVLFGILAGLFFATAIVNEKHLLGHMSIASYVVFGWGGQTLASVCLAAVFGRRQLKFLKDRRTFAYASSAGVLRGMGGILFMISEVKSNNVALVTVISNFRLILIVLVSAWLLKEQHYLRQKLIAAALSIAALTIIFWK